MKSVHITSVSSLPIVRQPVSLFSQLRSKPRYFGQNNTSRLISIFGRCCCIKLKPFPHEVTSYAEKSIILRENHMLQWLEYSFYFFFSSEKL